MTINGKRDHFQLADLIAVGESISVPRPNEIIEEIADVVLRWPEFARQAGLDEERVSEIGQYYRLGIQEL